MTHVDSILRIAPLTPADEPAALALLWPDLSSDERQWRGELLKGNAESCPAIWGGYRGQRLVGVMRVTVQPGRAATISVPRIIAGEPVSSAEQLLVEVFAELERQNLRIVQSLIPAEQQHDAELLCAAGMRHLADLEYLMSLPPVLAQARPAEGLELEPFREECLDEWKRLIARTYVGSLDCPATEGLRDLDDVLAGYRATGVFDPSRWLRASRQGREVGCLLLADDPAQAQWEVTYLGVVPEDRGQGWGLALVQHAQWLTHRAGRQRLVLAVDASNKPALAVYDRAGFIRWDCQQIYLRALGRA